MLIIMTVDAEVFPVAAILGVVVVVAVLVVDRQQLQVFPFKLTAAFGADPAVQFKGLLTIVGIGWLVVRFQLVNQLTERLGRREFAGLGPTRGHGQTPLREKR